MREPKHLLDFELRREYEIGNYCPYCQEVFYENNLLFGKITEIFIENQNYGTISIYCKKCKNEHSDSIGWILSTNEITINNKIFFPELEGSNVRLCSNCGRFTTFPLLVMANQWAINFCELCKEEFFKYFVIKE